MMRATKESELAVGIWGGGGAVSTGEGGGGGEGGQTHVGDGSADRSNERVKWRVLARVSGGSR